jgi:hypothetical protein
LVAAHTNLNLGEQLAAARIVVTNLLARARTDVTNVDWVDLTSLTNGYPHLRPQLTPLLETAAKDLKQVKGEATNFVLVADVGGITNLQARYSKLKELAIYLTQAEAKRTEVLGKARAYGDDLDVAGMAKLTNDYPPLHSELVTMLEAAASKLKEIEDAAEKAVAAADTNVIKVLQGNHRSLKELDTFMTRAETQRTTVLTQADQFARNRDADSIRALEPRYPALRGELEKYLAEAIKALPAPQLTNTPVPPVPPVEVQGPMFNPSSSRYLNGQSILLDGVSAHGAWRGGFIGVAEVTRDQYRAVTGKIIQGGDIPMTNLSPQSAVAFCAALTAKELAAGHIPAGWKYRLPRREEWLSLNELNPNPLRPTSTTPKAAVMTSGNIYGDDPYTAYQGTGGGSPLPMPADAGVATGRSNKVVVVISLPMPADAGVATVGFKVVLVPE